MGRIRKIGVAAVLAIVMAAGMSTTALAANKKPGGGGGRRQRGRLFVLKEIIDYKYVTPAILSWALALWNYYDCE